DRLALSLGDRLPHLAAVDIFPRRIDRLRPTLGLLPIILKRATALVLRLVQLAMAVQAAKRIVAKRAQRDDLFTRFEGEWIVDLDGCNFGVARQILRPAIMGS